MSDKIIKFYGKNAAENPDNVLEQAIGQYDSLLILGFNKDGELDPRSSLNLSPCEIVWLLEQFKHNLLSGLYSED